MKKGRIYISGKTEKVDINEFTSLFMSVEKKLSDDGWDAVNPIRICSSEWSWEKKMRRRIMELLTCDTILMLDGWKKSKSAKLEHFIALKLGMTVILDGGGFWTKTE